MSKLTLQYEGIVLKDYALGTGVTIGRLPDNVVIIDNPAVSGHHARVFQEGHQVILEDLRSTNGTFVNGRPVTRHVLQHHDEVLVGKHSLVFDENAVESQPVSGPALEGLGDTVYLDTKQHRALRATLETARADAARSVNTRPVVSVASEPRRVGVLRVVSGRSEQDEYDLGAHTSLIGRSDTALVRLRGWFKPSVAVAIARSGKGYVATPLGGKPLVNEEPLDGRHDSAGWRHPQGQRPRARVRLEGQRPRGIRSVAPKPRAGPKNRTRPTPPRANGSNLSPMQTSATHPGEVTGAPESVSTRPPLISEDWLSVLVGAALIALALAGARSTDPLRVALLVLVPLTAGAVVLGLRLTRFLPGVLLMAALAWLAQAIAALPMIAAWSLEYVVFALVDRVDRQSRRAGASVAARSGPNRVLHQDRARGPGRRDPGRRHRACRTPRHRASARRRVECLDVCVLAGPSASSR